MYVLCLVFKKTVIEEILNIVDAEKPHAMSKLSSGLMKITTHPDHMSHCDTPSGTNWSNRWTYRVFIINTHKTVIHDRCSRRQ